MRDRDTVPDEEKRATEIIVITDSQLTSSWDTLPTEQAAAETTDAPERSATPTPTPPAHRVNAIARRPLEQYRSFAVAALIVVLVLGVFAVQAIVKRLGAPAPVQRDADVELPDSPVASPTADPSQSSTIVPKTADVEPTDDAVAAEHGRPIAKPVAAPARTARVNPPRPSSAPPAFATPRPIPTPRPTVEEPARVAEALSAPDPAPPAEASSTAAAPAAPSAPPPPPAPAAGPVLTPDTRAVLGTLYRYQEAFSTLDSNAAQQVWPGVDVRALDRAFDQLDEQTFDLQSCDVDVLGERAEAVCTGTASYTRKVGKKAMRVEARRWRFALQRDGGEWLIRGVDVR